MLPSSNNQVAKLQIQQTSVVDAKNNSRCTLKQMFSFANLHDQVC